MPKPGIKWEKTRESQFKTRERIDSLFKLGAIYIKNSKKADHVTKASKKGTQAVTSLGTG